MAVARHVEAAVDAPPADELDDDARPVNQAGGLRGDEGRERARREALSFDLGSVATVHVASPRGAALRGSREPPRDHRSSRGPARSARARTRRFAQRRAVSREREVADARLPNVANVRRRRAALARERRGDDAADRRATSVVRGESRSTSASPCASTKFLAAATMRASAPSRVALRSVKPRPRAGARPRRAPALSTDCREVVHRVDAFGAAEERDQGPRLPRREEVGARRARGAAAAPRRARGGRRGSASRRTSRTDSPVGSIRDALAQRPVGLVSGPSSEASSWAARRRSAATSRLHEPGHSVGPSNQGAQ